MRNLRIGVATVGFQQPLKESLKTASDIGAQGVQFDARNELKPEELSDTGRSQFLHMLAELGLKVASLHIPFRRTFMDLEHLDARVAVAKAAMKFAFQLQASVVTARVGKIPTDKGTTEYQLMRQVLGDLAAYGNRIGSTFLIQPSQDSPEALQQLLGEINEGPLGIDFDPAGFIMAGQNPAKALRTLHNWVRHIQARDAIRDSFGSGEEVPLGRGEVDWTEFVALIDEIEYRGWIVANRTQGDNRLLDLSNAVEYLRQTVVQ